MQSGSYPWEDWAETWTHLLHMADTLSTALSFGLEPGQLTLEIEPCTEDALYRPDNPGDAFSGIFQFMDRVKRRDERNVDVHGITGFYPFALPYPAVKKLHFINVVTRTERDRYLKKAAG